MKPYVPLSTNVRAKSSLFSVNEPRISSRSTASSATSRGRAVAAAAIAYGWTPWRTTTQAYDGGVLTVSCHVERPLDDRVWEVFASFRSSSGPAEPSWLRCLRPPEKREGERWEPWLARAHDPSQARGRWGCTRTGPGFAHAPPERRGPGRPRPWSRVAGSRRKGSPRRSSAGAAGTGIPTSARRSPSSGMPTAPPRRSVPSYLPPDSPPRLELVEQARVVLPSGGAPACAPLDPLDRDGSACCDPAAPALAPRVLPRHRSR